MKIKKSIWANVIADGDIRHFEGFIETEDNERLHMRFSLRLNKKEMFVRCFIYILNCDKKPFINKESPETIKIKKIYLPLEQEESGFASGFSSREAK